MSFDSYMKQALTSVLDDLGAESERKSYQFKVEVKTSLVDSVLADLLRSRILKSPEDLQRLMIGAEVERDQHSIAKMESWLNLITDKTFQKLANSKLAFWKTRQRNLKETLAELNKLKVVEEEKIPQKIAA